MAISEGYPLRSSDTSGLLKDLFVKTPKTVKWYDMYMEKKGFSHAKVSSWSSDPVKLNSCFSTVAKHSLPSVSSSGPIHQDELRRWERSVKDQSFMCNQAAGFT